MNINEIAAVIEIGSNSVKLLVAKLHPKEKIETILYTRKITRLSEALNTNGFLLPEAMKRTEEAVQSFKKIALNYGAETIKLFATYAMRTARNADEMTRILREQTGLDIEILSGEQEAEISAQGAYLDMPDPEGTTRALIDIGGGSTEIVIGEFRVSLPAGGLTTSEKFLRHDPPEKEEIEKAQSYLQTLFIRQIPAEKRKIPLTSAGVGGTVTSAACLKLGINEFIPERLAETPLTLSDIESSLKKLAQVTISERKKLMPFDPERADSIIGGLLILKTYLTFFTINKFFQSGKNIIHGAFYRYFLIKEKE